MRGRLETAHATRQLETGCPFCLQPNSVELWFDPKEIDRPYQVRCGLCDARGPKCDCGEESAVPMWMAVESTRN